MESNTIVSKTSESYRKLAAEHMIPYAGSALNANVFKDIKDLYGDLNHKLPIWLLGQSRKRKMDQLLSDLCTKEGSYKDENGILRTYWTSEVGLIILVDDSVIAEAEKNLRLDECFEGYRFPDLDWLADSLEKDNFVLNTKTRILEWLRSSSDKRLARLEAEREQRARSRLQAAGVAETPETMELSREVGGFDVYYDYSDDHKYCIRYRKYERELRERLKALGMEAVLDNYIRSVVNRTV